jgi:hypothetical protein
MATVIQPGTAVRHRLIFELRYECGELYWDRCGRIARALAARQGWALQSVDLNGCHIRKEDENLTFTYSSTKLDLTQSQSEDVSDLLSAGEFAAIAEEFSEIVVRTLEVNVFPRIGFRLWTLYETESLDDASSRIDRMSFFFPCRALVDLGERSHVSHTVVIARSSHLVRVAATPFEQQIHLAPSVIAAAKKEAHKHWKDQRKVLMQKMKAKKAIKAYPSLGIMIDMDAYIEEVPYPDQVSSRTFIEEATRDFELIREAILLEAKQP